MHDDENLLRELLEAGARGYLLKSDAGQHLISAIQSLADHRPFLDRQSFGGPARNLPGQGAADRSAPDRPGAKYRSS